MKIIKISLLFCWLFAFEFKQTRNNINITYECIYNLGNIFNNDGECVLYGYNYDNKYKYFIIGNKLNNIDCNIQYKCIISNNINNIFIILGDILYKYSFDINGWVIQNDYVYKNNYYYVFNRRYQTSYMFDIIRNNISKIPNIS